MSDAPEERRPPRRSGGAPKKSALRKRDKLEREAMKGTMGRYAVGFVIAFLGLVVLFGVFMVTRSRPQIEPEADLADAEPVEPEVDLEPDGPPPPEPEAPLLFDEEAVDEEWVEPPEEPWREAYRAAYALAGQEKYAEAIDALNALLKELGAKDEAGQREVQGLIRYCCRVGADRAREAGDAAALEKFMTNAVDLPTATPGERATASVRLARAAFARGELDEAARRLLAALEIEPDRYDAHTLVDSVASEMIAKGQGDPARALLDGAHALDPTRAHPAIVIAGFYARESKFDQARAELDRAAADAPDPELTAAIAQQREWLTEWEANVRDAEKRAAEEAALAKARGIDPEEELEDDSTTWKGARNYRTKRFSIRSNLPSSLARWAGRQMDEGFFELMDLLGFRPPTRRSRVFLFRDQREYVEFCEKNAPDYARSGGFYDGRRHRIVLFARPDLSREHLLEGLLHEEVHYALHLSLPRTPRPQWLEEGLAQYLSCALYHDTRPKDRRRAKDDQPVDIPECPRPRKCNVQHGHWRLLESRTSAGDRPPLAEVVGFHPAKFRSDDMNAVYAEAFSLTRFLIDATDEERAGIPRLVPTAEGIRDFLRSVTTEQLGAPEVEAAWRKWEGFEK